MLHRVFPCLDRAASWTQPRNAGTEASPSGAGCPTQKLVSDPEFDITLYRSYPPYMTRKATTYRIDPVVQTGLALLSKVLGRPQNQLVNEAVRDFVARRSQEVEADLEATLESLRAYRRSDPNFDRALADWVDAEASLKEDPAEGRRAVDIGPAQARMLELLDE